MRSRLLPLFVLPVLLGACTVTRVGAEGGPPRIESSGLIDGHAAVGFRKDNDLFRLQLLDGESDGALAEVSLWKLFRLEIGALGVGLGIGPFDVALGALFYEPEVPPMMGKEHAPVPASASAEECEICRRAEGPTAPAE